MMIHFWLIIFAYDDNPQLLVVVILENILIGIKMIISYIIPDIPADVKDQIRLGDLVSSYHTGKWAIHSYYLDDGNVLI